MMTEFGYTLHKNNPTTFYKALINTNEYKFCIFSSDKIVQLILENISEQSRNYLMDATFKVCPHSDFNQLLIIYVEYCGEVNSIFFLHYKIFLYLFYLYLKCIPFIYVLTSRKTKLSYLKVFQYIESNIISLKCNSFMTDYETAMRNALKKISPDAVLYACWLVEDKRVKTIISL